MWRAVKPLTIELFEKYLRIIDPELQLFDAKNASYDVWQNYIQREETRVVIAPERYGMRHKFLTTWYNHLTPHGVIREIHPSYEFNYETRIFERLPLSNCIKERVLLADKNPVYGTDHIFGRI